MNKSLLVCLYAFLLATSNLAFAQINMYIAALPDNSGGWGVYSKICGNIVPSDNTITGSGQATIKFQSGATMANFASHAGTWNQNATVVNPVEAIGFTYVSIGFLADNPQIIYQSGVETLLFSFKLNGGGNPVPQIIQNAVDPFDQLPNSVTSNPGNELMIFDIGVQPPVIYTYSGNSATCGNTPVDTTVVDTTVVDTTVIDTVGSVDTSTTVDTTTNVDTSTVIDSTNNEDTTVITNPVDTTEQTSSVRDLESQRKYFSLYPTPAYEWVTVKFLDATFVGGTVRLFTMSGVPIGQISQRNDEDLRLNVGGLSSGLYFLTYEKNGKVLQRDKFIKQ